MVTNGNHRNYIIADSELCMFVSNFCNFAARDLSDFEIYGLTAEKIGSIKALGDEFERFPTDAAFVGDIMIATENKKALREQILEVIRSMAVRVEAKWGADSAKYKRLNLNNPSKLVYDSLLVTSRALHSIMTEHLSDLADLGLTQAMLNEYADLNEQFELAINAQIDAIAARADKTSERIQKGNELYNLVSMYCEIGKRIYINKNPAKYKDYLIYPTKDVQHLEGVGHL